MRLSRAELKELMKKKLHRAGLEEEHADIVADVLVHADARGIHSHGAMRVEYYAERISKGGTNTHPNFSYKETGPCSGIFDGDNGSGHVAAKLAMDKGIAMAKKTGISIIGVRRVGHTGALSYFVQQAARENLIGIAMCQSDPMAAPYGGAESYYGTHPIAFATRGQDGRILMMDLATTIQAWGKILDARSRHATIPDTWAIDADGNSATDPFKVASLVPIAGPKGYALQMMVDVLSGVLLGLPYGNKVTSMYHDLREDRNLGQLNIVINPAYFTDLNQFLQNITNMMDELNKIKPAPGFTKVYYPGQRSLLREEESERNGIEIVDEIYNYLVSDVIHRNLYDHKGAFAK
ncbi:ureidoglycolate dehydrogenase (NAD+) [Sporomusaceae bacterium BoRhaA]|uniref:ureidoglycolate dehydrogenase n=1 Tax=Pelorhabdus rhamnosifermentans TaxID=2772457 RepID=UPI001C06197B|nr:ureidoglycolate dehydrogenase [Pelorhabdus rhamnosifermentans]MBU2702488.1 ureidoglycolate dehydrogenase (NAD+) [Pelorhabdus rhamnosifermentans]